MVEEVTNVETITEEMSRNPSRKQKIRVQRGTSEIGLKLKEYDIEVSPGMVVLDAIHQIQAKDAQDLAVRWNCKAGKCGSCSAEVNGKPVLLCLTKMSDFSPEEPISVRAMQGFPLIKDLVVDVSWNYEVNKKIRKYQHPGKKSQFVDSKTGEGIMHQHQIDRVQEYRKCIECFLCQNTCHVIRDHDKKENFAGPRFLTRVAALEMHPLNEEKRLLKDVKDLQGLNFCNITRCCTEVCPEGIQITDNAIIPLKEKVITEFYDPVAKAVRFFKKLL